MHSTIGAIVYANNYKDAKKESLSPRQDDRRRGLEPGKLFQGGRHQILPVSRELLGDRSGGKDGLPQLAGGKIGEASADGAFPGTDGRVLVCGVFFPDDHENTVWNGLRLGPFDVFIDRVPAREIDLVVIEVRDHALPRPLASLVRDKV